MKLGHCEDGSLKEGKENISEYYGFTKRRHAGSFFLKIGVALFCFGHLIDMGLNIVKHVYVFNKEPSCGEKKILSHEIINSLFSLTQLCFIYNYGVRFFDIAK